MRIEAREETWPLKQRFRISRGSRTETQIVVATVRDDGQTGRGECVPLARYNQTIASVLAQIASIQDNEDFNRRMLQEMMSPGAARNALDCALWDLEAKALGKRAWEIAGIPIAPEVETSFTISLDTPEKMAAAAKANRNLPILKLKLGGDVTDLERVQAVRNQAQSARLLIDANESWTPEHYCEIVPALKQLGIELIEQPFPASADEVLENLDHPIPICADESCHTTADLQCLSNRYEAVNVKLDKTGGLTEALRLCAAAREKGFKVLIGCMVCTSLSIAPARLMAGMAQWIDLDGPLLIGRDRDHAMSYENGRIGMPPRELWG